MSIPENVHDFLVNAVDDATVKVSPFVRSNGTDFPFVIYDFQQDVFTGSTPSDPGPPLIQWEATVVDRTLLGAETIAQRIVDAAPGVACPVRVKSLVRSYEPSYDGQRPGEYVITINMENF